MKTTWLYVVNYVDTVKFGVSYDRRIKLSIPKTENWYFEYLPPSMSVGFLETKEAPSLKRKIRSIFYDDITDDPTGACEEWFKSNYRIQSLIDVMREGNVDRLVNLIDFAYMAHEELKDDPKYEGVSLDEEIVVHDNRKIHLSQWDKKGAYWRQA